MQSARTAKKKTGRTTEIVPIGFPWLVDKWFPPHISPWLGHQLSPCRLRSAPPAGCRCFCQTSRPTPREPPVWCWTGRIACCQTKIGPLFWGTGFMFYWPRPILRPGGLGAHDAQQSAHSADCKSKGSTSDPVVQEAH